MVSDGKAITGLSVPTGFIKLKFHFKMKSATNREKNNDGNNELSYPENWFEII